MYKLLPISLAAFSVFAATQLFISQQHGTQLATADALRSVAFVNSMLYLGYFSSFLTHRWPIKPGQRASWIARCAASCKANRLTWIGSLLASFMAYMSLVAVVLLKYNHALDNTVGVYTIGAVCLLYLAATELRGIANSKVCTRHGRHGPDSCM